MARRNGLPMPRDVSSTNVPDCGALGHRTFVRDRVGRVRHALGAGPRRCRGGLAKAKEAARCKGAPAHGKPRSNAPWTGTTRTNWLPVGSAFQRTSWMRAVLVTVSAGQIPKDTSCSSSTQFATRSPNCCRRAPRWRLYPGGRNVLRQNSGPDAQLPGQVLPRRALSSGVTCFHGSGELALRSSTCKDEPGRPVQVRSDERTTTHDILRCHRRRAGYRGAFKLVGQLCADRTAAFARQPGSRRLGRRCEAAPTW